MKYFSKLTFIVTGLLLSVFLFQSCLDKDDDKISIYYPNALVTVKHRTDSTFYLQLDAERTLLPTNIKKSPFGNKEVRALVNYSEVNEDSKEFTQAVHINWIDSILTKQTVPFLDTEEFDLTYGNDPVEIINDWVTIAEDSYLTLRFRTRWGYTHEPHYVNLVTDVNEDNPYEIEFRHNAYGDVSGNSGDALVAFSLKDLPDTNGETVKLKLTWMSFSGKKSAEFDYRTDTETKGSLVLKNDNNFIQAIK